MSNYQYSQNAGVGSADMSVDAGLRSFMLGIYNKMALGLVLSAVIAYVVGSVAPVTALVFGTPLKFVVMFGPIGILLVSSFVMRNPSPMASGIIYWSVVSLLGASLGYWVLAARVGAGVDFLTIGKAFFVTAAAFGGLSLFGYTTKKDLSGFGTFLIMGLIGLIIAGVVNMFMKSSMMEFIISVGGVLIFSGLTAYDTQRLKHTYYALGGESRSMAVATNYGALSLYLNFINLFQFILALMSGGDD
ncbi:Bax inhibitor-1/YccA family protein [Hirschia maritima]|uniref:Bax inhibitor-1/YccA family protein n=1 Tax=Hirschia maritima TaxID=1121961 RepID=UPI00036C3A3B|nr:Bax inhibitor-1/YccA family protein [Hirschia maritima]